MIPDIFKKEKIKATFETVGEAVTFLMDIINKQATALQETYKNTEEASYKRHFETVEVLRLLCDKLGTYGLHISYEDLQKEARAHIEKIWPRIKKEIVEEREAREKEIDEFLKNL